MLFIGFCAKAQTDCAVYHKGYFMYTDSSGNTILIHRQKKYQYQYDRKAKVKTQYAVAWIGECEYTITQTLTNSKALKKYKYNVRKIVITKSDGENGYYYTCGCIDDSLKGKESFLKKITRKEFYYLY
jgi:flagellar hook protein FlgE